MKKGKERKQSKQEKDRRALLEAVKRKLSAIRFRAGSAHMMPGLDEFEEAKIHVIMKETYDLEHIFFDLLLDNKPTGEILKDDPKRIEVHDLGLR